MKTYTIFLASSAELLADRKEFEIRINRINKDWVAQGVFLQLEVWEDFLDALSATRLQDEYNKVIKQCDLFVMLFWTKVGPYTEEEFDTAVRQFKNTQKPFVYTYFKEGVDPARPVVAADQKSLLAFKDKLKSLGHFYTGYSNVEGLQLHFRDQLDKLRANGFIEFPAQAPGSAGIRYAANVGAGGALAQGTNATAVVGGIFVSGNNTGPLTHIVNNHITPAPQDGDEAQTVITTYLQAMVRELSGLRLGQVDASADASRHEPFQLADIYVPLNTTLQIDETHSLATWLKRGALQVHLRPEPEVAMRPVSALEALAQHRALTLLGDAGSGKSTFGARVLLSLAQVWQGHGAEISQLGDTWTHGAKLPIHVVLRRFAADLPPGDKPARASDLWAFIGRELHASGCVLSADAVKFIEKAARKQGAFFLLDGLDECGGPTQRDRVAAAAHELMASMGEQSRFLLTARPYAAPANQDEAQGVYTLAELNDEQVEIFITCWYQATVKRQGWRQADADSKREELIASYHREDMLPPMLLTLLAILHRDGRMPEDRADLYDKSVDLLLLRWNQRVGADKALLDELNVAGLKLSDLREVLEELAFRTHEAGFGKLHGNAVADIGEDQLVRAFAPLLSASKDKADKVVDYIEKRAGILIGKGTPASGVERQFNFPHRTFQEFLAACFLARQINFPAECVRLARAGLGHWEVVLPLAARMAKLERGASAADALVASRSPLECAAEKPVTAVDFACAYFAGLQLEEIGLANVRANDRTRVIAARVASWLAYALPQHLGDGVWTAKHRAAAGDLLAKLGDPRFGAERFYLPNDDMLGFVEIPADPDFVIGVQRDYREGSESPMSSAATGDAMNHEPTPTPHFYIARYAVTVAQFRAFVEATRYYLGEPFALDNPSNRPVSCISWLEARDYCVWLTKQVQAAKAFRTSKLCAMVREGGWVFDLPNEPEWEKAARGGALRQVFSWGNRPNPELANYGATGIKDTCAVGCFPANGYGLHDMIGNVWEWTRSRSSYYPYPTDGGDRESGKGGSTDRWVVRGGAWDDAPGDIGCACRVKFRPGDRLGNLGFRVVMRSAPVGLR
jgi:formylglycine-generating enzyme required for sulfatase activity